MKKLGALALLMCTGALGYYGATSTWGNATLDGEEQELSKIMVSGTIAPGYQAVKNELQKIYDEDRQNSQLCIYLGNKRVVDLWVGEKGFSPDSLSNLFSSGKSVASILMGIMADKGLIDWDAPVFKYWPMFGQKGKDKITVAEVMRHEAGLEALSHYVDLAFLTTAAIKKNLLGRIIEKETPLWFDKKKAEHPNTEHERFYHAVTRDWITNEIFRRVEPSGRTMAEYLYQEFPGLGVYSGIQDNKVLARVNDLRVWKKPTTENKEELAEDEEVTEMWFEETAEKLRNGVNMLKLAKRAMYGGFVKKSHYKDDEAGFPVPANAEEWRRAEIFSANVQASARGLGELAGYMANKGTLNGRTIMSEKGWTDFHSNPVTLVDLAFQGPTTMFNGGVGTYPHDFIGWGGLGGSVFLWNPKLKLGIAFVPSDLKLENFQGAQNRLMKATIETVTGKKLPEDPKFF